ncbi:MAG: histidine phosphatase family protein [Chloroflexota bacterium]|nr:histidine phosphatase family protein [Chloroflexota bacterium]MDQ5865308.1 histidine phosphatase family protein [Chloroflexota bacterium]
MSSTTQTPPAISGPTLLGSDETLVYLVRHGQTEWNLERRFQGQLDVPLSAEGHAQAEYVANWLDGQGLNFVALYTSDLMRAYETAIPIGERLALVPQRVGALREINAGDWQGLLTTEIEDRYPGQLARWHREANEFRLPGGETIPEVRARVHGWYMQATEAHRGQAIIVVSHGMAIRSLLSALNGWDLADTERMKQAGMGNTGITAVLADHQRGQSSQLFFNSLVHLEAAARSQQALEPANEPAAV